MKEESILFLESCFKRLESASREADGPLVEKTKLQILSFIKGYICAYREQMKDAPGETKDYFVATDAAEKLEPEVFQKIVGMGDKFKRKYTRRVSKIGDNLSEEAAPKKKKINWRTIAKIQELKKAGYNSGQISEKLGLSLGDVNKYYAQKTSAHSY